MLRRTRGIESVARWLGPGSAIAQDALTYDWGGECCWLNPPYSRRDQLAFIRKSADAAARGAIVVALLPARTDTRRFHTYIWDAARCRPRRYVREVRFVQGRVRFVGANAGAPFPSMVAVWGRSGSELRTPRGGEGEGGARLVESPMRMSRMQFDQERADERTVCVSCESLLIKKITHGWSVPSRFGLRDARGLSAREFAKL